MEPDSTTNSNLVSWNSSDILDTADEAEIVCQICKQKDINIHLVTVSKQRAEDSGESIL